MYRTSPLRLAGFLLAALLLLAACSPSGQSLPIAVAGSDRTAVAGEIVPLDAGASSDPRGRALTYAWSLSQRPEGSLASIDNADRAVASLSTDLVGTYVVSLVVSNGEDSATDTLTVTAEAAAGVVVLEPGGSVSHPDGAVVAAQVDSIDGPVELLIEPVPAPTVDTPLPAGIEAVTDAFTFSAPGGAASDPDAPFVIGLVVPDGEPTDNLAIAVLEQDALIFPPEDADAEPVAEWVFLEGTLHSESRTLLSTVFSFPPDGWTAMIVRGDSFETLEVAEGAGAIQATGVTFQGRCGTGFDDAVETCSNASTATAAAMLEDAYSDLTALGFTSSPRLERGASSYTITYTPPLQFQVTVVPGPYRIELRPSSTSNAGGMYNSGTGRVWIAIGTSGMTESRRSTVRHEYVHATQFGYNPSYANSTERQQSRWSLEGQAVLLQGGFATIGRESGYPARNMSYSLLRSRWTGSDWRDPPNSEYHAQDFWWYLANRFGHTSGDFLRPFMVAGQRTSAVDSSLRSVYPDAFGQPGQQGGLSQAYWDWTKNHVFEKQVTMDSAFGQTCSYSPGSASLVTVNYSLSEQTAEQAATLEPLSTQVYRVNLPASPGDAYRAAMRVSLDSANLRSTIYHSQPGSTACHGQANATTRVATALSAETYYVIVSNVSMTEPGDFTLSFPSLSITHPAPGDALEEGQIAFRAETPASGSTTITWTRTRPPVGTVISMGTTGNRGTLNQTLCDGTHHITASATIDGLAVSRSIAVNIADLGATDPPAACAPSVTITLPLDGGAQPFNREVPLRASTSVAGGGFTGYPVQWRLGDASGQLIATGADTTAIFRQVGPTVLHVSYGSASDTVSFPVLAGEPPVARILRPSDGDWFAWHDADQVDPNGATVQFAGLASGTGGLLGPDTLEWSYRRLQNPNWQVAGTGVTPTVFLSYFGANVTQTYEVMLTATDPATGLSASDTIQIVVQRPPD